MRPFRTMPLVIEKYWTLAHPQEIHKNLLVSLFCEQQLDCSLTDCSVSSAKASIWLMLFALCFACPRVCEFARLGSVSFLSSLDQNIPFSSTIRIILLILI